MGRYRSRGLVIGRWTTTGGPLAGGPGPKMVSNLDKGAPGPWQLGTGDHAGIGNTSAGGAPIASVLAFPNTAQGAPSFRCCWRVAPVRRWFPTTIGVAPVPGSWGPGITLGLGTHRRVAHPLFPFLLSQTPLRVPHPCAAVAQGWATTKASPSLLLPLFVPACPRLRFAIRQPVTAEKFENRPLVPTILC
jgi:hypothetical protein